MFYPYLLFFNINFNSSNDSTNDNNNNNFFSTFCPAILLKLEFLTIYHHIQTAQQKRVVSTPDVLNVSVPRVKLTKNKLTNSLPRTSRTISRDCAPRFSHKLLGGNISRQHACSRARTGNVPAMVIDTVSSSAKPIGRRIAHRNDLGIDRQEWFPRVLRARHVLT